jgi:branched-chain amino acid transport system permease protein
VQQFLNVTLSGLAQGAIYAAFALALVLIWRSTRIVNFAQGAMAMFTTYLALAVIDAGGGYWLGLVVALVAGLVLGAVVERLVIRPVEGGPELNAVIVTLGLFVGLQALAAVLFGSEFRSFPAPFDLRGFTLGGVNIAFTPNSIYVIGAVVAVMAALVALFRFTDLGLRMRAAAFSQEVSRLLGVRVGAMLTLGWALAAVVGSLSGLLIAGGGLVFPAYMDAVIVYGFVAAVLGGLDSPGGAVVGGLAMGLALSYVSGFAPEGSALVPVAALAILVLVLLVRPQGLFAGTAARRV